MHISPTDTRHLIHLLESGAALIDKYAASTREADKARQMRKQARKLKKKCETPRTITQ